MNLNIIQRVISAVEVLFNLNIIHIDKRASKCYVASSIMAMYQRQNFQTGTSVPSTLPVPQILFPQLISDKTNWVELSGYYVAQGLEKYLTIGNFFPNQDARVQVQQCSPSNPRVSSCSYVFLDLASLKEVNPLQVIRKPTLTAFASQDQKQQVTLEWTVENPDHNLYDALVESSTDLESFKPVGEFLIQFDPKWSDQIQFREDNLGLTYYRITLTNPADSGNIVDQRYTYAFLEDHSLKSKVEFQFGPNPNRGQFKLTTWPGDHLKSIVITDIKGKAVWQLQSKQTTLQVSIPEISAGTYYLTVKDGLGRQSSKKMIVIP